MESMLDLNKMGLESMSQNEMALTEGGSWIGAFKYVVSAVADIGSGFVDGFSAGWNAANNG